MPPAAARVPPSPNLSGLHPGPRLGAALSRSRCSSRDRERDRSRCGAAPRLCGDRELQHTQVRACRTTGQRHLELVRVLDELLRGESGDLRPRGLRILQQHGSTGYQEAWRSTGGRQSGCWIWPADLRILAGVHLEQPCEYAAATCARYLQLPRAGRPHRRMATERSAAGAGRGLGGAVRHLRVTRRLLLKEQLAWALRPLAALSSLGSMIDPFSHLPSHRPWPVLAFSWRSLLLRRGRTPRLLRG